VYQRVDDGLPNRLHRVLPLVNSSSAFLDFRSHAGIAPNKGHGLLDHARVNEFGASIRFGKQPDHGPSNVLSLNCGILLFGTGICDRHDAGLWQMPFGSSPEKQNPSQGTNGDLGLVRHDLGVDEQLPPSVFLLRGPAVGHVPSSNPREVVSEPSPVEVLERRPRHGSQFRTQPRPTLKRPLELFVTHGSCLRPDSDVVFFLVVVIPGVHRPAFIDTNYGHVPVRFDVPNDLKVGNKAGTNLVAGHVHHPLLGLARIAPEPLHRAVVIHTEKHLSPVEVGEGDEFFR
jgi:hypothetical protein